MRILHLFLILLFLPAQALSKQPLLPYPEPPRQAATISAVEGGPVLQNPGFECGDGYHDEPGIRGMVPNGWTATILSGEKPFTVSTQLWAKSGTGCDPTDMSWEKLEGYDSNIFMAAYAPFNSDFSAPPFDIVLHQTTDVSEGTAYSLSAWMTSLCGGSSNPNDCPPGAYIAKMAGLDGAGGTSPTASTVQWVEDRRSHIEARWVNLSTAAVAQTSNLTVFLRINSPFYHHGNHVFADAVKLVRAPTARFTRLQASDNSVALAWTGERGADIAAIPAGNYRLSFDVQVHSGDGIWQSWLAGQEVGNGVYAAPRTCTNQSYRFRVRSWAFQPAGERGAWPNHRFVGVWEESDPVVVPSAFDCQNKVYLPAIPKG